MRTKTTNFQFGSFRSPEKHDSGLMPGRTYASEAYSWGFNDQEKDNEICGNGINYAFKYRMNDSRTGRFFSVDPLFKDYPFNSTYAFAENTVIWAIELEGLEAYKTNDGESIGQVGVDNSERVIDIKVGSRPESLTKEEQLTNLTDAIAKANEGDEMSNLQLRTISYEAPSISEKDIIGTAVGAAETAYTEEAKKTLKYGKGTESADDLTKLNKASSLKTAKYLKFIGSAIGVHSAYEHINQATDAYEDGEYGEMLLNIGKTAVDGFFIFNKSANPIWFGISVGYTAFDIYTTKKK